mgnify:FL=1
MWWHLSDANMYQTIGIKSRLALDGLTETPMVWLNECIDAMAKRGMKIDGVEKDDIGAITFDTLLR